jgi:hypothetical protein
MLLTEENINLGDEDDDQFGAMHSGENTPHDEDDDDEDDLIRMREDLIKKEIEGDCTEVHLSAGDEELDSN